MDPWKRLTGEMVFDAGIFRLRREFYEFRGAPAGPFYVLQAGTWANVVAVTPGGEVVLVRQFRHGTGGPSLEVPGGIVDPEDPDPASGALRELLEETGYSASQVRPLGRVSSNPAILDNETHFFVAEPAHQVRPAQPGHLEEIEVALLPLSQVLPRIRSGEIHHSLSVAALTLYLLERLEA